MTPRTQTAHTPGPWAVAGSSIVTHHETEICIAVIEDDGGYEAPIEERIANAELIAAAPDLLAACQAFLDACEPPLRVPNLPAACKLARAAIARANA